MATSRDLSLGFLAEFILSEVPGIFGGETEGLEMTGSWLTSF